MFVWDSDLNNLMLTWYTGERIIIKYNFLTVHKISSLILYFTNNMIGVEWLIFLGIEAIIAK